MNQTPKVVGFVPAYKAEKFILKTLEALASQTYPNFEIIVCDDSSPDGTASVCEEFCKMDDRFRFIQNPKNLGWFKTSEMLWLEASKNSGYCFTNPHDDLHYPEYISTLVRLMEENPRASLAIPGMENEYPDSTLYSFYQDASGIEDTVERCFRIAKKDQHHWWAAYHGLYRSEFVSKIFPIDKLPFGESEFSLDLILMLKMGFHGQFVTSDKILFKKVYLDKSVSDKWKHNATNKAALWTAIWKEIRTSPLSLKDKKSLKRKLYTLLLTRLTGRATSLFK